MKLLSVATLQAALRIAGDLSKVNAACSAALDNATARVAAEMRGDFKKQTGVVEEFYVRPSAGYNYGTFAVPNWKGRFALSNGFVSNTPVLTYGGTRTELIEDPATVEADYVQTNAVRGEVVVHGFDLRGKFVRVTYNCGFEVDGSDATLYTVPNTYPWLVEAAKDFAYAELLRTSPSLFTPDKEAGSEGQYAPSSRAPERNAVAILQAYIRYFPDAIRPAA